MSRLADEAAYFGAVQNGVDSQQELIESLREQLAASQKREVMLREVLNGCHDEATQAWLDDKRETIERLDAAGFTVSFFPMEQKWLAFKDYVAASAFHDTVQQVAEELLK